MLFKRIKPLVDTYVYPSYLNRSTGQIEGNTGVYERTPKIKIMYKKIESTKQLKKGVVLVDKNGNKRKILKRMAHSVLLTHKNSTNKGASVAISMLFQKGDRIEINWTDL